MKYFDEWKMILFLGTPVMPDLEAMVHTGLFINDLSMHDFSRFVVYQGWGNHYMCHNLGTGATNLTPV